VKVFEASGKTWYLMSLYIERVQSDPNSVAFSYSLSNDGKQFGPEQILFTLAQGAEDSFGVTPAFVTRAGRTLRSESAGSAFRDRRDLCALAPEEGGGSSTGGRFFLRPGASLNTARTSIVANPIVHV
jgi:hypothetical protein